ncbi:glycosyltransferase [bacterium]|nr:glycosyltransferase [bacterium]
MCLHTEKTQHSQRMSEEYEPGLVSVIIPTFNRAHFVKEAIDSVLSQTYQNFEIIVVDDGSTDDTKHVLIPCKDKIIYIYQENQGGAAVRNTGIKHAKGKYIAFLDSDDLWFPQKLEKQVNVLNNQKEYAVVYSNLIVIDGNHNYIRGGSNDKRFPSGNIFHKVLLWQAACGYLQTLLVRKSCFEEIGYLDVEFAMAHDRDMVVRLARRYKMYGMKEPLAIIRQHKLTKRVRDRPAKEIEYYWFKFLDKLFDETDGELLSKKIKRKLTAGYYFFAGRQYLKEMDPFAARKRFLLSISNYPLRPEPYLYLISTLMGVRGLKVMFVIRKLILTPWYYLRRRYAGSMKRKRKT